MSRLARALPSFRDAQRRFPGEGPFSFGWPLTSQRRQAVPQLWSLLLFRRSFSTNFNSETADGLSLNPTQGWHQWGRKAQWPPPGPCFRVGSELGRCGPEQARLRLLSWGRGLAAKVSLSLLHWDQSWDHCHPLSLPPGRYGGRGREASNLEAPSKFSLFLLRILQKVSLKPDSK